VSHQRDCTHPSLSSMFVLCICLCEARGMERVRVPRTDLRRTIIPTCGVSVQSVYAMAPCGSPWAGFDGGGLRARQGKALRGEYMESFRTA